MVRVSMCVGGVYDCTCVVMHAYNTIYGSIMYEFDDACLHDCVRDILCVFACIYIYIYHVRIHTIRLKRGKVLMYNCERI